MSDPRDPTEPARDPRDPGSGPAGGPGPTGGSGEDRPAPLIPSRAARHQAKRRLFRGRPAAPTPQPPPTTPEPPPARPEPPAGAEPPARQAPPDWVRPAPDPTRQARVSPTRPRPEGDPAARRGRPRMRPVPDPREGDRDRAAWPPRRVPTPSLRRKPAGPGPEEPGERPAAGTRPLRLPGLAALRGSGIGLAGGLVVAVTVLALAVNALPAAKPPATPPARDPYSARWVCPLLPGQSTPVTIANVGGAKATLRTTIRETGKAAAPASKELAGGATQQLSLKPAKAAYVQVEAFSAPVVVSAPGLGCAPGPGTRWWLPASDTRLGTDTQVIIANPDNQPAVVDLVPHLTSGSIRPERDLFVKPGEAVVQPLGDDAPAGLKPSIEVVAKAGRVVVGAAVTSANRQPTLLPAQGASRPAWSFAGGLSGGGRQAQVLVTNPNPTPLQVNLQVVTAKGTFRPPGEFDEPIANGGTAELAIPTLEVKGPFAVQVRSLDGAPFVAALRVSEGDGSQLTSRIDLGTGQAERGWLVPGPPASGQLVLANLSPTVLEARLGDLTAGGAGAGDPVRVQPGRVAVQKVPEGVDNLLVQSPSPGLVAAPLNGGPIVPGSTIGGLPAGGPIVPGPAAAP